MLRQRYEVLQMYDTIEVRGVAVYVFFVFFAFVVFVVWLEVSNFALGRWILFSGVQSGCMIFGMGD